MEHSESTLERKLYRITGLPQQDRKISNKPSNPMFKTPRKTTTNKAPKRVEEKKKSRSERK